MGLPEPNVISFYLLTSDAFLFHDNIQCPNSVTQILDIWNILGYGIPEF